MSIFFNGKCFKKKKNTGKDTVKSIAKYNPSDNLTLSDTWNI